MVSIEELRSSGLMRLGNPLCLGGGHGVRAYLPKDIQRFSIDLDFYSGVEDIHNILTKVSHLRDLKPVGYGIESEGRFKRYDSPVPAGLKRCTIALIKHYDQSFKSGDVEPEFFVTVSNILPAVKYELRKPKSYIEIEYVREKIPVLSPALIIAGKIGVLLNRKVKDFYKDVFDIYALLEWSDWSVDQAGIISGLSAAGTKVRKVDVYNKFRQSSDEGNARTAIRLPSESRQKYLAEWKSINSFVREKTLALLEDANAFI